MKRLISILLLFTFSLTLVGYNLEVHYCDGEITDVSSIGKSECVCDSKIVKEEKSHCEMSCDSHDEEETEEDEEDCCKTEKISIATTDILVSSSKVNLEQVILLSTLLEIHLFSKESRFQEVYDYYKPPSLVYDIPINIQSFLI